MSDILVIRCKTLIHPEMLKNCREIFLAQKESGVVVLPAMFEAIVVPDDIEIKIEGPKEV